MARILITGGTGFVGSEIRRHLPGYDIRLLVRSTGPNEDMGDAEQVVGDVTDPNSLRSAFDNIDAVIHLVAIIEESGPNTFDLVIRQGTENMVAAAQSAGVRRFVHMSALGAQQNPAFPYLNAKWSAEEAIRNSGLEFTILRPTVIFGPKDGFINVLADLVRKAPVLPVVGSGQSKFQPVAVGDVADSFQRVVIDSGTVGKTYELGGGETYSYEEMLDLIAAELGKSKMKVHVPVGLMKTVVKLSSTLPKSWQPPVTREQLNMLALDNCTGNSATEDLIGRKPVSLREGIGYIRSHCD